MTYTIELTEEDNARLRYAESKGVNVEALFRSLLAAFPATTTNGTHTTAPLEPTAANDDPTIALFATWANEDAGMTVEEIEAENKDFEQFKNNLNQYRREAGARLLFPE